MCRRRDRCTCSAPRRHPRALRLRQTLQPDAPDRSPRRRGHRHLSRSSAALPRLGRSRARFAELFAFNSGFNALVDAKYFRPPLPIVDALRAHAPREPFRVAGLGWILLPNSSAQYGLGGCSRQRSDGLRVYDRYLRRFTIAGSRLASADPRREPARAQLPERSLSLRASPMRRRAAAWRLLYRGADGTLWENPAALPRFFARGAQVRNLRSTAPGEFAMTVVAPSPALIESSEALAPGRRVYVARRRVPLHHIENTFIGGEVPAGESDVRVVYRPISFYASCAIALLTALSMWFWPMRSRNVSADDAD